MSNHERDAIQPFTIISFPVVRATQVIVRWDGRWTADRHANNSMTWSRRPTYYNKENIGSN